MCQANALQIIYGRENYFCVGEDVIDADNVDVPLEEFAESAFLGTLGAAQTRDGKPFYRLGQGIDLLIYHSGKGGRDFGPDGKFSAAAVGEREKLLDDFIAAFYAVHIEIFEYWAVVFLEAVADGGFFPAVNYPVSDGHILRIKISCAFYGRYLHNLLFAIFYLLFALL
jgi:hypothetical protein